MPTASHVQAALFRANLTIRSYSVSAFSIAANCFSRWSTKGTTTSPSGRSDTAMIMMSRACLRREGDGFILPLAMVLPRGVRFNGRLREIEPCSRSSGLRPRPEIHTQPMQFERFRKPDGGPAVRNCVAVSEGQQKTLENRCFQGFLGFTMVPRRGTNTLFFNAFICSALPISPFKYGADCLSVSCAVRPHPLA